MASLYANENFPQPVVEELRTLGYDVVTVRETGKAEQSWPDSEVLAFATANNRVLLTLNRRHFRALHDGNPNHAGIVLCTVDLDHLGQAQRIHDAITAQGDCTGQLLRVNRPNPKPR